MYWRRACELSLTFRYLVTSIERNLSNSPTFLPNRPRFIFHWERKDGPLLQIMLALQVSCPGLSVKAAATNAVEGIGSAGRRCDHEGRIMHHAVFHPLSIPYLSSIALHNTVQGSSSGVEYPPKGLRDSITVELYVSVLKLAPCHKRHKKV